VRVDYCEPKDLYSVGGLQPGALANPARIASTIDPATDTIALDQHGFGPDQRAQVRPTAGGSLPAPLSAGTVYYAIPVSESLLSLAATPGGAAINLTTTGSRVMVVRELPIAEAISWASRIIDQNLPAHAVPKDGDPIHELVRMTCAELAVGHLLPNAGNGSKSLSQLVDAAVKRLAVWAANVPLRGPNAPQPTGLAVTGTGGVNYRNDWSRYGGTC
jgi:hypothetical protein